MFFWLHEINKKYIHKYTITTLTGNNLSNNEIKKKICLLVIKNINSCIDKHEGVFYFILYIEINN